MTKILILQGANLNWLGRREPEKYGTTTAEELDAKLRSHAERNKIDVEIVYCNVEGNAIDILYDAELRGIGAVVMNPGGFSHSGFALRDCIQGIEVPLVEVHITNHYARGIHCITSSAAQGIVMGLGVEGYFVALDAASNLAELRPT